MAYSRYPYTDVGTVTISGPVTGTFQPLGLSIAGRMTVVTLNDSTWTPLPAVPLVKRNGISVQNQSATEIKLNYDPLTVGYVGAIVNTSGERFYDIQDSIILYGKCMPGTGPVDILIEELS
jgi:hypothetical protein